MTTPTSNLGSNGLGYKGFSRLAVLDHLVQFGEGAREAMLGNAIQRESRPYLTERVIWLGDQIEQALRCAVIAEVISGTSQERIAELLGERAADFQPDLLADEFYVDAAVPYRQSSGRQILDAAAEEAVTSTASVARAVNKFLVNSQDKAVGEVERLQARSVTQGLKPKTDREISFAIGGAMIDVANASVLHRFPKGTDFDQVAVGQAIFGVHLAELGAADPWIGTTGEAVSNARDKLAGLLNVPVEGLEVPPVSEVSPQAYAFLNMSVIAREVADAARTEVASLSGPIIERGQLLQSVVQLSAMYDGLLEAAVVGDRVRRQTWDKFAEYEIDIPESDRMRYEVASVAVAMDILRAELTAVGVNIGGPQLARQFVEPQAIAAELDAWTVGEFAYPDTPAPTHRNIVEVLESTPAELVSDLNHASHLASSLAFGRDAPSGLDRQLALSSYRALQAQLATIEPLALDASRDLGSLGPSF